MAHSFISGQGLEFQVRDGICEAILERLRDELEKDNRLAYEVVAKWFDYWYWMPPGTKDLKIECSTPEIRNAVIQGLSAVIQGLPPYGELILVAKQMSDILTKE